jgi:gluconokinase
MITLVMGVEGSGKSTVGRALAEAMGWTFADGDDFHSAANKQKLHNGTALTDRDRAPWLSAIHAEILEWHKSGTNAVLAASALRESYRQQLFEGLSESAYCIVYLCGPENVLAERVRTRVGHFASPTLLESQIRTLESPKNAINVSIAQTVPEQVDEIRAALRL